MKIKAISLWEPWASLIRIGAKTIETRSWATAYRGRLLVCAAQSGLPKADLLYLLSLWSFQGALAPLVDKPLNVNPDYHTWSGVGIEHLNFGKAVAVVDVVDCKPTGEMTLAEITTDEPFGDFSLGRFGWKLKLINAVEPFPVKGHQGFFEVELPAGISAEMEAT